DGSTGGSNVGKRVMLNTAKVGGTAITTLAAGQYLVILTVGQEATVPAGTPIIAIPVASSGWFQNAGAKPDAVGIFDTAQGKLVDSLSYQGQVTGVTLRLGDNTGNYTG